MNTLYIHIGAGKTGSSALQVWLHNNREILLQKGKVEYPVNQRTELNRYEITSGNGVKIVNSIRGKKDRQSLEKNFKSLKNNTLYSSEAFQDLNESDLELLREIAKKIDLNIHIIVYIRDVYDMAYSSYQQLLKRNLYTNTFAEYCENIQSMQQFDVLEKFASVFSKISVLHYDTEHKKGIEKAFLRILKIDENLIPPMQKTKVNRSLSLCESELQRHANTLFKKNFNTYETDFSTRISDALIYKIPEKKIEILYDEDSYKHLVKTFRKNIEHINEYYFNSHNTLQVFNSENKNCVTNVPILNPEYKTVLTEVISYMRETTVERIKAIKKLGYGNIDYIDATTISGWAILYDSIKPPMVELYINNKLIKTIKASLIRKDLLKASMHKTGECGFKFELKQAMITKDDIVQVKIKGDSDFINIGNNALKLNQQNKWSSK